MALSRGVHTCRHPGVDLEMPLSESVAKMLFLRVDLCVLCVSVVNSPSEMNSPQTPSTLRMQQTLNEGLAADVSHTSLHDCLFKRPFLPNFAAWWS
jgi:hypothetical protein